MPKDTQAEFVGCDAVIVRALSCVLGQTGISSIPIECLSEYAKSMTSPRYRYESGRYVQVEVGTDCEYGADRLLVVPDGLAGGLVACRQGHVGLADGHTIDDLVRFMDDNGIPQESDRPFVSSECHSLLHGTLVRFLGTKQMGIADIPAGRPLVLVDIDDCINVIEMPIDGAWEEGHDAPPEDLYDIDRDEFVMFPEEVIGMRSFSGRRIPERMHVRWSSELTRDMARLHAETDATLVWLSSWQECSKCFDDTVWPDGTSPFSGYREWHLRGLSDDGRHGKALSVSELLGNPRGRRESEELARMGMTDDCASDDPRIDVPCVVVIDDKGTGLWDGFDVFESAIAGVVPSLTVAPDGRYGVTRTQWKAVEDFVKGHSVPR